MIAKPGEKAVDKTTVSAATLARGILLLLIGWLTSMPAAAHFQLNNNIRIIHIETTSEQIRLSLRIPTVLVFSEFSGETENSTPPYLTSRLKQGQTQHFLDRQQIEADLSTFKTFLIDSYALEVNGDRLSPQLVEIRVFEVDRQTRFSNPAEVSDSFAQHKLFQSTGAIHISDSVIDIQASFATTEANGEIRLYNTQKFLAS